MRDRRIAFGWFAASAASAAANPPPLAEPELTEMRAQLYYEGSGRLSDDILSADDFILWNTTIGEGSADENANDLLVSFRVQAQGEATVGPIKVEVTGSCNRVVLRGTIGGVLTTPQGTAWKAVMLYDITCDDPLRISATMGRSRLARTIHFACGE